MWLTPSWRRTVRRRRSDVRRGHLLQRRPEREWEWERSVSPHLQPPNRHSALAAGAVLDERREERKAPRQIDEDLLHVALDRPRRAVTLAFRRFALVAPGSELRCDGLLQGLAIGEVCRPARAAAKEVDLVQR